MYNNKMAVANKIRTSDAHDKGPIGGISSGSGRSRNNVRMFTLTEEMMVRFTRGYRYTIDDVGLSRPRERVPSCVTVYLIAGWCVALSHVTSLRVTSERGHLG